MSKATLRILEGEIEHGAPMQAGYKGQKEGPVNGGVQVDHGPMVAKIGVIQQGIQQGDRMGETVNGGIVYLFP